jgi:two-component system, chemotaxis family, protein-glutamate methylesterase/glutaminase
MITVLIVDDSPVVQSHLAHILSMDPEIKVVGAANNGEEALRAAQRLRPTVITMDIHMPIMDGLMATRLIMEKTPTPIVIVSGSDGAGEMPFTFRAMEAGALAVAFRPPSVDHVAFADRSRELIRTVKLMSEIKVVRRTPRSAKEGRAEPLFSEGAALDSEIALVAIGASTGGPPALKKVLAGLPKDFCLPLLVVQHLAAGFAEGFAEWLSAVSGLPVHIAKDRETPLPGHVYLAPDGLHLGVTKDLQIELSADPPENGGLRPSVAHLFRSVARGLGAHAVGILLTGMGGDGAKELKQMREAGALTIAQDEESSLVYGMPGEAIRLDAAAAVLPPEGISRLLGSLAEKLREGPSWNR